MSFKTLINKLLPVHSKRRLFAKLIFTFLLHPLGFISKFTFKSIFSFFYVLNTEGISGVSRRINYRIYNNRKFKYLEKTNNKITDYEPVIFKKEDKPVVSIIIPVYNQFNFTYYCLKSIFNNSGDKTSYEIIIADDCSNDLTINIKNIISNIKVITTPVNMGFLRNCNNAAKYSNGKYILFLNNDTQVQKNWLMPLIELIEKDNTIGAVGSKIIFPNGLLLEAVGMVWNDGSAWNYGRFGDPSLPEYNYIKEVDYLSGAALMVKKSIWEKLGGFDEVFVPAYYEDPDLCFSIRKMGYKVMYQPKSVVVHYEGISNGNNPSQGLKQYQVINQKKFYEKWKDILEQEHFPNGKNVFLARDRSRNKKTILMIDDLIPDFDKDEYSKIIFHILSLFASHDYNVKFIGDNFCEREPYANILEQMGIEVLYGTYYAINWKTWLRINGRYIDYVFLNNSHVSKKYTGKIRKYIKNCKIFSNFMEYPDNIGEIINKL
jgi:GT2 family glycosyltransferase